MSTTHCRDENEVFRSTAMSGSATVTMVTSTSSMNVPRHTAISGIHLRIGMFLCPGPGRPDDGDPIAGAESPSS